MKILIAILTILILCLAFGCSKTTVIVKPGAPADTVLVPGPTDTVYVHHHGHC